MARSMASAAMLASLLVVSSLAESHMVVSRGATTCETWLAQRPRNSKAAEAWLLGYLSGLAQERDRDLPNVMDDEAMFRWADDYCRSHPKATAAVVGVQLMSKLRSIETPR